MRVLVTGAAGFLGSHICNRYLDDGNDVIGIDDFCSSSEKSDHLKSLKQRSRHFTFFECDVSTVEVNAHVDLIINMACPASPPAYQSMPVHTMMTCVNGVQHMLELACTHGAVFVQASTSEVYGDPINSPQRECDWGNVNSYGPRSCYDEGKRAAESLCYDYFHSHGVDARLVRIFNTYGPCMDPWDGRVVSNFIRQALQNDPITLYGTGKQTRSFCYVSDTVDAIVRMAALKNNPLTPINVGNPNEFTIIELYDLLRKKLGDLRLEMKELPVNDPTVRRPDITLARNVLGWEPRIELSEGLDMTIEHFRRVLK